MAGVVERKPQFRFRTRLATRKRWSHAMSNRRFGVRPLAALLVAGACLAAAVVLQSRAAEDDPAGDTRHEFLTPGLLLETGARTAACDVLVFTQDGKHLLAAGDDKVVRTWDVTAKGLRKSNENEFPILRWPIHRENYGAIYAMALSPDETHVVVAGQGMRTHGFEAAVIDRKTGALLHGMEPPDKLNEAELPYRRMIWSLAFSPSGKRVAVGTATGGVWLWDLEKSKSVKLIGDDGGANPERVKLRRIGFLAFDGEDHVVSVNLMGHVLRRSVLVNADDNRRAGNRKFTFDHPVASVSLSRDRRWLAGVLEQPARAEEPDQVVQVVSFPDCKQNKSLTIGKDPAIPHQQLPHRTAFSADAKTLAVAVRWVANLKPGDIDSNFFREPGGQVLLFDLSKGNAAPRKGPVQTSYAEALTFHPRNSALLAVAGGDNHEVTLWDTSTNQAVGPAIRSPGHCLWGVALDPHNRYVAFQEERAPLPPHPNRRGRGAWRYFDIEQRKFADAKVVEQTFRPKPTTDPEGWKVHFTKPGVAPSSAQWFVEYPNQQLHPLPFDEAKDEFPRCYAFVPADAKKKRPLRLAVGHYWGFSLYDLPPEGPRRSRLFWGHDGYVAALAVSPDGSRIVTASRDQTLAGWNLDDWPSHPTLGASFLVQDGAIVVKKVDAGSPAWEFGLNAKDRIVDLSEGRTFIYPRPKSGPGVDTDADIAAIQKPRPGARLEVAWRRGAKNAAMYGFGTVVDRPMWRMFPSGGNRWVLWQYRNFFYDCQDGGDFDIGWQRSYDLARVLKRPDFYAAEQFRQPYHKPEIIQRMLRDWTTGDVQAAKFLRIEPPEVTVTRDPPNAGPIANEPVRLRVVIRARGPADAQQPRDVLLWVNDYLAESHKIKDLLAINKISATPAGLEYIAEIPANRFRTGENRIIAQCYSKSDFRDQSREPVTVARLGKPAQPKLVGLIAGVGQYKKRNSWLEDLQADNDAEVLHHAWKSQQGKLFHKVELALFRNGQVTRKAILDHLDVLADRVSPDDLLLLHLGGHGISHNLLAKVEVAGKRWVSDAKLDDVKGFLFCCADLDGAHLPDTTINFDDLYAKLVKLPCHKLILIDACHSGDVQAAMTGDEAPIRILTKDGIGPVILAACAQNESAIESKTLIDLVDTPAFGYFSIALRELLQDDSIFELADRAPRDGKLSADEVANAVTAGVQRILVRQGVRQPQHPSTFLPTLEKTLPLMQWDTTNK
jgi:WD40 repeat protein